VIAGDTKRRPAVAGLTFGLVVYGVARLVGYLPTLGSNAAIGMDHALYMGQAHRVLAGGPLYPVWESLPFTPAAMPELYPPLAVYGLFVPMALLPDILWWAIPLAVTGAIVWAHRPSPAGWLAIAALAFLWPHTLTAVMLGNPVMWVAMVVALGTRYGWPAVLVVIKPTLAPFALIGIRHRSWWIAALVVGLLSLVALPAYLTVLANLRGADWSYSLHDAAFVAIPIVASLGTTSAARGRAPSPPAPSGRPSGWRGRRTGEARPRPARWPSSPNG
jgi:hypothetical protein